MYQKFSRMKGRSRSDRTRKMPSMKKIATHVAVTFRRNGIFALAIARASVLPAAGFPSSRRTTATAREGRRDVAPPFGSVSPPTDEEVGAARHRGGDRDPPRPALGHVEQAAPDQSQITPMSPNIAMSAGGMGSLVVNTRIGRNSRMRAPCSRTTHDPSRRYFACGTSSSGGDGWRGSPPPVADTRALTRSVPIRIRKDCSSCCLGSRTSSSRRRRTSSSTAPRACRRRACRR